MSLLQLTILTGQGHISELCAISCGFQRKADIIASCLDIRIMIVFNFPSGTVWTVRTSSTIVVKQQMANAVEFISASNLIVVFTRDVQHSIQIFLLQQVCMFKICKRIQLGQNPFSCMRKITLSRSLLSNISKALFTTVYRFRY